MIRKIYKTISLILAVSLLLTACGTIPEAPKEIGEAPTKDIAEYVVSDVNFDSTIVVPKEDNHRVFYEIFVGSFSDSNGDGTGDLRGIINRFDYLNDGDISSGKSLGIEGIWLSPINESPSYHKYDVADYYAIDDEFGTMEDLKELVNLAHERGVKVIMDMVINHSSSENTWFKYFCQAHRDGNTSSKWYDFYSWAGEPVSGRTFKKIPESTHYYECNFSGDMPELNYDNEEAREEVLKIASYYLNDIGIDGFRFDAAKYIYYGEHTKSVEFWKWYMEKLYEIKPDLYAVAEVWDPDSITDLYEPAVNCFDFTMSQTDGKIASTAMKGDVNSYVAYVEKYINRVTSINEKAMILPFIANHDMDRAAGFVQTSTGFAYMAANLYILGPGSPFIYYGEEIGMKGSRGGANTDANRRLAMLWGDGDTIKDPIGTDYDSSLQKNGTVADQLVNGSSILNYYKRLLMIRKANPEIALGDYDALSLSDTKVSGFVSTYEGSGVCVIHNTSGNADTVDLSKATDITLTTISSQIGVSEENASLEGSMLTIPAQTSVVLR